jgi:hypothetical protein
MFQLGMSEEPVECHDILPNELVVKGHGIDEEGHLVVTDDCKFCGLPAGKYVLVNGSGV